MRTCSWLQRQTRTKVVPDNRQPSTLTCSRSTALQKISGLSLWLITAAAASANSLPRIMSHMCDSHSVDTCIQATSHVQTPLLARVHCALQSSCAAGVGHHVRGPAVACRGRSLAGRCMQCVWCPKDAAQRPHCVIAAVRLPSLYGPATQSLAVVPARPHNGKQLLGAAACKH